jgi:RNA polymerase sigma factor (TIGR02999 family)
MRRILVERARKRIRRQRLTGAQQGIDPQELPDANSEIDQHVIAVHEAIEKLNSMDPVHAELVKLRFFAGVSLADSALALDISESTAQRYWNFAKAWLHRELK